MRSISLTGYTRVGEGSHWSMDFDEQGNFKAAFSTALVGGVADRYEGKVETATAKHIFSLLEEIMRKRNLAQLPKQLLYTELREQQFVIKGYGSDKGVTNTHLAFNEIRLLFHKIKLRDVQPFIQNVLK